jgi:outer membrane protein
VLSRAWFAARVPGLLLLVSFSAVPAGAADLKIGFIDSERIFAEYKGTKDAQAQFQSDLDQWNREVEQRRAEMTRLTEEYQNQALILSEAKRREREEDLQEKRSELDAFVQEIWGPNGRVAQRNDQLTRPIIDKIKEVLGQIGADEGFSIIFDATDGNVVYADDALDLTERVLTLLNAQG